MGFNSGFKGLMKIRQSISNLPLTTNYYNDKIITCVFSQKEITPKCSCTANARVKLVETGHGPHYSTLVVTCVVRLLFVLFYVLFVCKCVLSPGDNPTAVNKYINTIVCIFLLGGGGPKAQSLQV